MSYKDLLLSHLASYRRDVLKVAEPGIFMYRKRPVPVEHILPASEAWLGIPEAARSQVRAYAETRGIKLHRYFHHLNSSQAFALSLFVPFFEGGEAASSALLRALGSGGKLSAWKPEAVPDREEGTNLDAWWQTTEGSQYFCEVKLTEEEFGTAKNDPAHQRKLTDIYAPRLAGHIRPERLAAPAFFASYQILRNLWHAAGAEDARVVFLYPRQHTVLTDLLEPVLEDVKSSLRSRVVIAHAEDVLARLRDDAACPAPLRSYAAGLASKYLLGTP